MENVSFSKDPNDNLYTAHATSTEDTGLKVIKALSISGIHMKPEFQEFVLKENVWVPRITFEYKIIPWNYLPSFKTLNDILKWREEKGWLEPSNQAFCSVLHGLSEKRLIEMGLVGVVNAQKKDGAAWLGFSKLDHGQAVVFDERQKDCNWEYYGVGAVTKIEMSKI